MLMNNLITAANEDFFLQNSGNTGASTKKSEATLSFKEFLSSNIKAQDAVKVNTYKELERNTVNNSSSTSSETKADRKSFRQLEKDMKLEAARSMVRGKKTLQADKVSQLEDLSEDDQTPGSVKPEMMINCLAQILGMKAEELASVLEASGIKLEELASVDSVLENRLQKAFGPDHEMGAALGKILKKIEVQVDEAMKLLSKETRDSGIDWSRIDELLQKTVPTEKDVPAASAVDNSLSGQMELSETMSKLRHMLKEMNAKMETNEAAFDEEIQAIAQSFIKDTTSLIKSALIQRTHSEDIITDENEKVLPVEETEVNSSELKETAEPEDPLLDQTVLKTEIQEAPQNFANVFSQFNTTEIESEISIDKTKMPVPEREILSQVIEKAKVVMTADKTEMAMELKPESLGKLSLKVITENGIVMAKFVAENQQVKQVLETNMQLLKDSLEKQGLNVQGFSVSVRQESQYRQRGHEQEGKGRSHSSRTVFSGQRVYADISGVERLHNMNPYRHEENTINITA